MPDDYHWKNAVEETQKVSNELRRQSYAERSAVVEVAMVFDLHGRAIFWPSPKGSSGAIPDSRSLWDVLWENRETVGGVAHTHPWDGPSGPSGTDLTTFAAIEAGLGRTLLWPIVTMTHIGYYERSGTDYRLHLYPPRFEETEEWKKNIEEMRRLSRNGGEHGQQ